MVSEIRKETGTAIIVALTFLSVLGIMSSAFVSNLISSSNFGSSFETGAKSFYIAEAGLNHALWKLSQLGNEYRGDSGVGFADGEFDIIIEDDPKDMTRKVVVSCARLEGYPDDRTGSEIRAIVSLQKSEDGKFTVTTEQWENVRSLQ